MAAWDFETLQLHAGQEQALEGTEGTA